MDNEAFKKLAEYRFKVNETGSKKKKTTLLKLSDKVKPLPYEITGKEED